MAAGAMAGAQVGMGLMQLSEAKNSADAIRRQAEFDARQSEYNASLVKYQKSEILSQAQRDTQYREQQVNKMIGTQKVSLAAQGIEVGSELGQALEQEERRIGAEDVQAIKNNAWREVMGLEIKRTDLMAQAGATRIGGMEKARTTLATGGISAVSSFVSAGRTLRRG